MSLPITRHRRTVLKMAPALAAMTVLFAGAPALAATTGSAAAVYTVEFNGVVERGPITPVGLPAPAPLPRPGNVTLTRPWTGTTDWYRWRKEVLDGVVDRKSVSIILLNASGQETARTNLFDCWPSSWLGPRLGSVQPVESLTIHYDTVEWRP